VIPEYRKIMFALMLCPELRIKCECIWKVFQNVFIIRCSTVCITLHI